MDYGQIIFSSKSHICMKVKYLHLWSDKYAQDEKKLQAESLKEIKHKTKCKVCQGEFKNRQVRNYIIFLWISVSQFPEGFAGA